MRVFVTGAAGYIGSVVVERLIQEGHEVVAFDSLKYGHQAAIDPAAWFVKGDLRERTLLSAALRFHPVDAVIHLGAESYIDDSITDPGLFFDVNTLGTSNLLNVMAEVGCRRMIFSSTAAVFGEPDYIPIDENHPKEPVNPYGESKLQAERMFPWFHRAHGINHVSLRYFNACGATEKYGEARTKETHIIPLLLEVANGRRQGFTLFGTDYDTRDGTCVRDYVHVIDIADAHIAALSRVDELKERAYNLGSGRGYSNREVIGTVREVTGVPIEVKDGPRRPGDPAQLVATHDLAKLELGWNPKFQELAPMVESAWKFKQSHPNGYQ